MLTADTNVWARALLNDDQAQRRKARSADGVFVPLIVFAELSWVLRGIYPLLIAPYITRALAERCRELQLPFIDTAGNAYINVPGLIIYVTGEPRPATLKVALPHYRAYTEVGMKVIFALLCDAELADATYREIARVAQVGFGTVGPVIKDLENRGHLVQRGRRKTLVKHARVDGGMGNPLSRRSPAEALPQPLSGFPQPLSG